MEGCIFSYSFNSCNGNGSNDGYYLDREYLYTLGFITRMANGLNLYDSKNIIEELKRFGMTHVSMTDELLRKPLRDILEDSGSIETLYSDRFMKIGVLE